MPLPTMTMRGVMPVAGQRRADADGSVRGGEQVAVLHLLVVEHELAVVVEVHQVGAASSHRPCPFAAGPVEQDLHAGHHFDDGELVDAPGDVAWDPGFRPDDEALDPAGQRVDDGVGLEAGQSLPGAPVRAVAEGEVVDRIALD